LLLEEPSESIQLLSRSRRNLDGPETSFISLCGIQQVLFYLTPKEFIPGTLMEYEGPKDPYRISCVVEYLVTLKMQQNNKLGRELDEEY